MGDPAGIGPEIVLKTLRRARIHSACRPVVFGTTRYLKRVGPELTEGLVFKKIESPADASFDKKTINVVESPVSGRITVGKKSAQTGKAALDYLDTAIEFALRG